jgi:hypothetical protein
VLLEWNDESCFYSKRIKLYVLIFYLLPNKKTWFNLALFWHVLITLLDYSTSPKIIEDQTSKRWVFYSFKNGIGFIPDSRTFDLLSGSGYHKGFYKKGCPTISPKSDIIIPLVLWRSKKFDHVFQAPISLCPVFSWTCYKYVCLVSISTILWTRKWLPDDLSVFAISCWFF